MAVENENRVQAAITVDADVNVPDVFTVLSSAGIIQASLIAFNADYPPAPFPVPYSGVGIALQLTEPIADENLIMATRLGTPNPDTGANAGGEAVIVFRDSAFPNDLDRFVVMIDDNTNTPFSVLWFNITHEDYQPIVLNNPPPPP